MSNKKCLNNTTSDFWSPPEPARWHGSRQPMSGSVSRVTCRQSAAVGPPSVGPRTWPPRRGPGEPAIGPPPRADTCMCFTFFEYGTDWCLAAVGMVGGR